MFGLRFGSLWSVVLAEGFSGAYLIVICWKYTLFYTMWQKDTRKLDSTWNRRRH